MDQPLIGLGLGHLALFGSFIDTLRGAGNIVAAAIALGVIIFVHELGHFVVAKLCGVKCEKFFLGFDIGGRKIWSFQWGETVYGIGILPLGGYVKMLGQDDNPSAAAEERERAKLKASEAGAEQAAPAKRHSGGDIPGEPTAEDHEIYDPRSYMAKSVPQRMAIISAGVISNLIFAVIFATIAYRAGVNFTPCVIGEALAGDPAWKQGIQPGDRIVAFDGDKPSKYLRFDNDLLSEVMFTGADTDLKLTIRRPANVFGDTSSIIDLMVRPTNAHEKETKRRMIGVAPAESNQLQLAGDSTSPALPHTPAAEAKPGFEGGDHLIAAEIDGKKYELQNGVQIEALLAQNADKDIQFTVSRGDESNPAAPPKKLEIKVAPAPLHYLGLVMQMGPIAAVQKGSPAEASGFRAGDTIKSIDGKPVDDPVRLPDELAQLAGKDIAVVVDRTDGGHSSSVTLHAKLRSPLTYNRGLATDLMACDALGIAYPVLNTVATIAPDAMAGAKQLKPGDKIVSAAFAPDDEMKKQYGEFNIKFPGEPLKFDDDHRDWPELQAMLQMFPTGTKIKLTFNRSGKEMSADVSLISVPETFYPGRGFFRLETMSEIRKANSWGEAARLGWRETKESVMQVVTTLRKVASGEVSATGLGGPGTIAVVAAASASQGIPKLLIFLTFLSANLAVINFLPIPILDGGHMMFLLYEGIRGKPASERVQIYLTYFGLVIILALFIFVIGLDITRFVKWIGSLFS